MVKSKLAEAIEILYEMESHNYFMTCSINEFQQKAEKVAEEKTFRKPAKLVNTVSELPYFKKYFLIFMIIGCVLGLLVGIFFERERFYNYDDFKGFFFMIGLYAAGGALLISVIGMFVGAIIGNRKVKENQLKIDAEYINIYKQREAEAKEKEKINKAKKEALITEKNLLSIRLEEAKERLAKFYDTVGIDQKFRNLVPIGYMHEMIRLGIADKLEGVDGLYYLIMKELRWDQMTSSLSDISSKLDVIIDNQKAMYYELTEIKKQSENLVNLSMKELEIAFESLEQLKKIDRSTAVTAYNSKRIKRELSFDIYMEHFADN